MTKFAAALITILVAGVVPFGRAICQNGEVGVSQTLDLYTVSSIHGLKLLCHHIRK